MNRILRSKLTISELTISYCFYVTESFLWSKLLCIFCFFLLDEWLIHKERWLSLFHFYMTYCSTIKQNYYLVFLFINDRLLILVTIALMVIHVLHMSGLLAYVILIFTHGLIALIWLLRSDIHAENKNYNGALCFEHIYLFSFCLIS